MKDVETTDDLANYDLVTDQADFPHWEGKPLRTVLICTHMRSGSTLLGEAMTTAGQLGCPIEYFHVGFQPHMASRWQTADFESYVQAVYRNRTDPSGTLGVKLFWRDIEDLCATAWPEESDRIRAEIIEGPTPDQYKRIHELLLNLFPNPLFVYLYRSDRLRQAISLSKAVQSGKFRSLRNVTGNLQAREFVYDHEQLLRLMALGTYCDARWRALFAAANIEPIMIRYEDLATQYEPTVRDFLIRAGVVNPTIRVPRLEQQSDRLSEDFMWRFLREESRTPRSS